MTTTPIEKFNVNECEMIDGKTRVNAYTDIYLDPENPTGIVLDTTWGEVHLDLKDVVKNGETITHLRLSPADDPTVLRYEREDGGVDCITGEELSKIIYLRYLADVEQPHTLQNGEVLMYDSASDTFKYYNLASAISLINTTLGSLQTAVTNLQNSLSALTNRVTTAEGNITNLQGRMSTVEAKLTPPSGVPNNVKVAFGNINTYGDITNTNLKTSGIYTHSPNTNVTNDQYFS